MPLTIVTSNSVPFRAFDIVGNGSVYAPMHMHLDEAGAQITKDNALPVGGGTPKTFTATIPISTALSQIVDLGRCVLAGLILPATWDAANISFRVSADGTTAFDLFDGTTERVVTTAGVLGKAVALDSSTWLPWRYVVVRSGVVATPVNQTAARNITLLGVQ
jgi:hypothetical protein